MKRLLTNAMIVLVVSSIIIDGVPINFPGKEPLLRELRPAMIAAGLWQSWKMFAPLPPRRDCDFAAEVLFADGTSSVFWLPRIETMTPAERYVRERYRKFELNSVNSVQALQEDAVRFIARASAASGRKPVTVRLVEFDRLTPPPNHGRTRIASREILLDYRVRPEDLQ
jgi:hypothetical protein